LQYLLVLMRQYDLILVCYILLFRILYVCIFYSNINLVKIITTFSRKVKTNSGSLFIGRLILTSGISRVAPPNSM